ncbi:MAG: acyl-CoA synthetase [Pseudomonadales bacterium]|nr:acyl-CoA synthetase [Pseudomonadales bacterium]
MQNLESMADVLNVEQTHYDDQSVPQTTYEIIQRSAIKYQKETAIEFFLDMDHMETPFSISYQEFVSKVNQAGNMFRSHGIGRDDVIAFVLPNLPETHYTIWGGEAAGTVLSLNPLLETEQLATLLKSAKAKWLVCLGPTPGSDIWQKCIDANKDNPHLKGIFQVNVTNYLTGVKRHALNLVSKFSVLKQRSLLKAKVINFNAELKNHNAAKLNFEAPYPNQIASCFCTGGTTGLPKIATRKHSSEAYNAWAAGKFFEKDFTTGSGVFCGLPLFHVNGQIVTGLTQWLTGGRVVMGTPQGYRGEGVVPNFWKILDRYKLRAFSGVPTLYAALVQIPIEDNDISSLEAAICGAAPMPKELFRKFKDKTGVSIIEGYGLTEGTCVSSINPGLNEDKVGSIGYRLPYQEMKALVLDDDGNYLHDADTDEVACIAIQGPNVFSGYIEDSHNEGIWIDRNGTPWLNTGDLGREDQDGYFWLTGRKKELIIRGGHNIDPKTIEEALHKHPKVKLAAAIGRPDDYAGELPVAYVELQPGEELSEAQLMSFAEEHITEKAAIPKSITVLDTMPITPVGKIFKPTLTMMEIESLIRQEAQILDCKLNGVTMKQDSKRGLVALIESAVDSQPLAQRLDSFSLEYDFV